MELFDESSMRLLYTAFMHRGGRGTREGGIVLSWIRVALAPLLIVGLSSCIEWILPEVAPDSSVDGDLDGDLDADSDADTPIDSDTDGDTDHDTAELDGGDGDIPPAQPCHDAEVCETGNCVDGFCCDLPCQGEVCQRCDAHSTRGAGRCSHVRSSAEDPDDECTTAPAPRPGSCRSETCSGTSYSCGSLPVGEQGQPACLRCPGDSLDPAPVDNQTQDDEGTNLCNESCQMCFAGECTAQWPGMDIAIQCGTGSCCGAGGECVVDSCNPGSRQSIPWDRNCDECTDEYCWNEGYCARWDCGYIESFERVMCTCAMRSSTCGS